MADTPDAHPQPSAPSSVNAASSRIAMPRRERTVRDIIAGASIAGLLLPEAVAYAGIANLPPQAGLLGLLAGLIGYGLIGNSRFAIVSSTSSSAAVLAAVTVSMSGANTELRLALAAGAVILAGAFLMIAGAARLGSISDFIAKPVLRGFTFGLALTIIVKQLAKVAGVHPTYSDLPRYTAQFLHQIGVWNGYAMGACFASLALLLIVSRWHKLPGPLIVIIVGIAAGYRFDLHHYGIPVVGTIDLASVSASMPALPNADWARLGELAVAVALIIYAESYGSIRSFALKYDDPTSPNRDLIAIGASNLVSGLLHGMPVGAGYSGTSANEAAGAQTRLAGWCAAVVVAVIVALLLPQLAHTPEPVLSAIVIYAVGHTLNPKVFKPYWQWQRDRLLVATALIAVLLLGILNGLLAAIGVSVLLALRNFAEPKISQLGRLGETRDFVDIAAHADAQLIPGLLIVRPEAPMFFANAERVLGQIRRLSRLHGETDIHTVLISLEESPDVDGSTIEALRVLAKDIELQGQRLLLVRIKPRALEALRRATDATLPSDALYELSVDDCVQAVLAGRKT